MRFDPGIAFGAAIIAVGLSWLIYASGQSPHIAVGIGLAAAILDYVIVAWMKSRGLGK